jgi:hypothetical protein
MQLPIQTPSYKSSLHVTMVSEVGRMNWSIIELKIVQGV